MDESNKTMISKMMLLLNEYQRKAFLGLYYEKLGYESATQISNLMGMNLTMLTAAKRDVAELKNNSHARP